jgi:hypothetical protein
MVHHHHDRRRQSRLFNLMLLNGELLLAESLTPRAELDAALQQGEFREKTLA